MSVKTWIPFHPTFEAAEYFLKDHVAEEQPGSSDDFPFETLDEAYDFCLAKIIDEMKKLERQKGQREVQWIAGKGGYYWGCIWGSWGGTSNLYNVWTPENQEYSINQTRYRRGRRSRRKRRKPKILTYNGQRGHLDSVDGGGTLVDNGDSGSDDEEEKLPDNFPMEITIRTERSKEDSIPEYLLDMVYKCGDLLFDTDGVWSDEEQQQERCAEANKESDPEESDPEESESDRESDAIQRSQELYVYLMKRLELFKRLSRITTQLKASVDGRDINNVLEEAPPDYLDAAKKMSSPILKEKIGRLKSVLKLCKPLYTSSKALVDYVYNNDTSSSEEEDEQISDNENWQD